MKKEAFLNGRNFKLDKTPGTNYAYQYHDRASGGTIGYITFMGSYHCSVVTIQHDDNVVCATTILDKPVRVELNLERCIFE